MEKGLPEKQKPSLYDMKATYLQEPDTESEIPEVHELKIKTHGCGDSGIYYTISTGRWAFDDIDELIDILQDFKKRVEL